MQQIHFNQAVYSHSAHYKKDWPEDSGIEIAFAGRSNVGKSSAINAITNHTRLAKTSKTPGRTQQIVFFDLDEQRRLVDLPGYGYAKAPEHMRKHWEQFLTSYLSERECLKALVIPMDIRRPLTDLDKNMLEWSWDIGLYVHILLTKSDKFKRGKAANILLDVKKKLASEKKTSVQLFSSLNKQGVDQARERLTELYQLDEERGECIQSF